MIYRCVEWIKKNKILCATALISLYAFYLRLAKLYHHDLWPDELCQISLAGTPFLTLVKTFPQKEFCAYIACADYFLTYPFAKIFGLNKWGIAIPHIVATILGFYILYLVCKMYFKTIWGYIVTFTIVCFNATLINHATEIRVYAVLPTLALAVFYFSQVFIRQPFMGLKKKLLLGIFFIGAIWFHPYGVVMVFTCFVYALGAKLHTPEFAAIFKKTASFLCAVFGIAMPLWLLGVFGPHTPYLTYTNTFEYIPNPIVNIKAFLKTVILLLVGYKMLYFLLLGALIPVFIHYKDRFKQIGFLLICVLIPIQFVLLSDLFSGYWFVQRQFIWVMPLFAFFLGWCWESLYVYTKERLTHKNA